ncbi:MAG: hypothetical protein HQK50_05820 [Oligoflexia bacterium]|nr:hypothetical protein [Oligoflexia bacterium]MBF0365068.1 hypothetical protein [Oligoflexia bacterium]
MAKLTLKLVIIIMFFGLTCSILAIADVSKANNAFLQKINADFFQQKFVTNPKYSLVIEDTILAINDRGNFYEIQFFKHSSFYYVHKKMANASTLITNLKNFYYQNYSVKVKVHAYLNFIRERG